MKTIYFLIIGLISNVTAFSQENCPAIKMAEDNKELAKGIFRTKTESERINGNTYVSNLSAMSDEKFNALCERFEYNPNFEQAKKNNPNLSSYVMYAKNFTGETNIYTAILDNYRKELENLPQNVKKRLQVIDNTIKMYEDLQEALNKEIQYNTGEILDNGINLEIKHIKIVSGDVSIPGFSSLNKYTANLIGGEIMKQEKEIIVNSIGKQGTPIDNPLADKMNACFKIFEGAAVLDPPLRLITEDPWYKVFVSLPEAGKIIGHTAAIVNIYFRKNEYSNFITELEKEKQYILKYGQVGPVITSAD